MENRVLVRKGAREINKDELELISGSNGTRVTTLDACTTQFTGGGNDSRADTDLSGD